MDADWGEGAWPFLLILICGALATDVWRFLGVYLAGRISETSEWLTPVRAVATALVAGVIGNLIVFPSGALAATPLAWRIAAAVSGFAVYLIAGRRMVAGILAAEAVLIGGMLTGGGWR